MPTKTPKSEGRSGRPRTGTVPAPYAEAGREMARGRESLDLTQEQFAGLMDDVSQATVSRWEAGTMRPSHKHLAVTAALFHKDGIDWLTRWLSPDERSYITKVMRRRPVA